MIRKNLRRLTLLTMIVFCSAYLAKAQKVAVKTNLLYDVTTSMNVGVEVALAQRWTLELSGNYNPWTFADNKKIKHWMVQSEARYWLCKKFTGHFIGVNALYIFYNIGGMLPFGIKPDFIKDKRYEGWAAAAGVNYGYSWPLSKQWSVEPSVGFGYARLQYNKYACQRCGTEIGNGTKNYFGPTKAAISIVYIIK